MEKFRTIVAYKNYFEDFLKAQPFKVQNKIYKIFEIIEFQQFIPIKYLKHIEGTAGLYEVRISFGSNIWRIFCFFDEGKLVILLNGFQKKDQESPKEEIQKAIKLKNEFNLDKRKNNEKGKH